MVAAPYLLCCLTPQRPAKATPANSNGTASGLPAPSPIVHRGPRALPTGDERTAIAKPRCRANGPAAGSTAPKQPLKEPGSPATPPPPPPGLHMTIQTAVLIETLTALGAEVPPGPPAHLLHPGPRRCAWRQRRIPVSPYKGENPLTGKLGLHHRILEWGDGGTPNRFSTTRVPPASRARPLRRANLSVLETPQRRGDRPCSLDPGAWRSARASIPASMPRSGVTEETTKPAWLAWLPRCRSWLSCPFPAINVNDSVHQEQVRQPLTACREPWGCDQARHHVIGAGKVSLVIAFTAMWQGFGPVAAGPGLPR